MYALLFSLAASFPHATAPANYPRLWPAVIAVVEAVRAEGCFPRLPEEDTDLEACVRTASVALVWAVHESALHANPNGHNDAGSACGVMQVSRWHLHGDTCDDLRRDLTLGFRWGVRLMRNEIVRCGSSSAGLGAYSTRGVCGGAPKLVARRCGEAGGC